MDGNERRDKQVAMDGSPAVVTRTLADLFLTGKFKDMTKLDEGMLGSDAAILIHFQCGPLKEVGVNGCSIEDVIDVLVARLEDFQAGSFKCRENALAITKLQEAKHWLGHRTALRQQQGVEGTMRTHTS